MRVETIKVYLNKEEVEALVNGGVVTQWIDNYRIEIEQRGD